MEIIPSEEQEQEAVIQWAEASKAAHSELALLHHIANGGFRTKRTAAMLKRLGVKPGVPDLFLPVPRNGAHGLFIEMKRIKGGRLSPYQEEWIRQLTRQGYTCAVCAGAEAAIGVIRGYLDI